MLGWLRRQRQLEAQVRELTALVAPALDESEREQLSKSAGRSERLAPLLRAISIPYHDLGAVWAAQDDLDMLQLELPALALILDKEKLHKQYAT